MSDDLHDLRNAIVAIAPPLRHQIIKSLDERGERIFHLENALKDREAQIVLLLAKIAQYESGVVSWLKGDD